jgi:hypothetical protein
MQLQHLVPDFKAMAFFLGFGLIVLYLIKLLKERKNTETEAVTI